MFIGHYAVGLAAKRIEPSLPLWALLAAPQALDLVWPLFVLLGIERAELTSGNAFTALRFVSYPWSHSLGMAAVWGVAFAIIMRLRGASGRAAAVVGLLVMSHWVLDLVTHRADMPLWPADTGLRVGLGLWNSVPATLVVEVSMYIAGVALYTTATRPTDRWGTWAWVTLVLFLSVVYVGNVLGPPPPSVSLVAWLALAFGLIPVWGWRIERHRVAPTLELSPAVSDSPIE